MTVLILFCPKVKKKNYNLTPKERTVVLTNLSTALLMRQSNAITQGRVNKLDIIIPHNSKDIIQKYTSGLFKNATIEFFGLKTAKIKELINVELPVVEIADTSTDFVFLLEDDSCLHYEFQTDYDMEDLIRFAEYDLRLYKRDKRKIQTVIIYSANVKKAAHSLDIGSLVYTPINIMLCDYDGNKIYSDLESKLKAGQNLTDIDMLNIIFLPLMSSNIPKNKLAIKSVGLAQTIQDKNKRDVCIASAVAFMSRYLNDNEINSILEVLKMTDIWAKAITQVITEEKLEIAKKAIKKGLSLEDIADLTGVDIDTIKALKEQLEQETEQID